MVNFLEVNRFKAYFHYFVNKKREKSMPQTSMGTSLEVLCPYRAIGAVLAHVKVKRLNPSRTQIKMQ